MENNPNRNTHNDYTYDSSDWQYEETQKTTNHNKRKGKYFKRAFALGATSAALFMLGGQKLLEPGKELIETGINKTQEILNPQTIDKSQTDLKIDSTSIDGLVNHEIDFGKYTEIELGDKSATIILKDGDVVRTTDRDYTATHSPDNNDHTAVLKAKEELKFKIDGQIFHDSKTGYIVTNIDNFKQTASGETTGLKTEIDKDSWVAIESPEISYDQE